VITSVGALRAGDLVEVRSKEEILATLDENGLLDHMPFMPEMLEYCGRRLRVSAVAHKTCDTATKTGGRRIESAVHLEDLRCDGGAHGGCQAECRIFWKQAWLRRVERGHSPPPPKAGGAASGCTEARLREAVYRDGSSDSSDPAYSCQATRLPHYTRLLAWWDVRQYVRDVKFRNHSLAHTLRVLFLASVRSLQRLPRGYRIFLSIYSTLHRLLTGRPIPYVSGAIRKGEATPHQTLDLEPGDAVRIKPIESITRTLDTDNRNRGLSFDPEMARYCGERFTVRRRVTRIIDERSGKMVRMKNPCITLDGVVCAAEYTQGQLLCPRAITSYWREIWLERIDSKSRPGRGAPAG
jgi:hypothetical protein